MENTTALVNQNQLADIAVNGSEILEKNTVRVQKALTVGNTILELILAEGMNPELDVRANNFLVNCRTAKNEMEVARKPITQLFDSIKKQFTESENQLDITKTDSLPSKIQAQRNAYVQKIREEELKRQAEAQKKIDHDNELIEIKANIEKQLSDYLQNHTLNRKQNLQASFNTITLETFVERSKALKDLKPTYKEEHYHAFSPEVSAKYCTAEEIQDVKIAFIQSQDFHLLAAVIEGELTKFKNELVEKLPSLKTQLDELAKAGEEEKKRLEQEKADREKQEQADLEAKAKADAQKEQELIDQKKTSAQTDALMDNLSVTEEKNTPENRSAFNIVIANPAGILEIVNFWFQKEGFSLTVAELEKKTIAQMKTFCQNYAHKHSEEIVSKNLRYEPVFKAVNRK